MSGNIDDRLLPCPFCGSTNLRTFDNTVACKECDACGPDLGHCTGAACRKEATEAWNRRAAPAAVVVPTGYRLVPEEPTEEMKVAGLKEGDILGELIDWRGPNSATRDDILRVWSAMLSASPVPSTATQAGVSAVLLEEDQAALAEARDA